jgi:hypothetical protein
MTLRRAIWLSLLLAPLGCGEGVSPLSGVTAYMRATGTGVQFEEGELTIEDRDAEPTVETIRSGNTEVFPGAQGRSAGGTVSTTSSAVMIGLSGDSGHWLLPVGVREAESPYNFTFTSSLSFSPDLPLGKRQLIFRAIDAAGRVGPAQTLSLQVADQVTGPHNLMIQLIWDSIADLDLHVRIPNPNAKPEDEVRTYDVWARAPRALPPRSGMPYTQAELDAGGRLQYDSNAQCTIDAQNHEELIFPGALPAGPYEIRVDTFNLCGEPTARWWVGVLDADDNVLDFRRGQSTDRDTFASHGADSGTLAFTFEP